MADGEGIIYLLATLAALYFIIDFFFWNGGFVDPAIFTRMKSNIGMVFY